MKKNAWLCRWPPEAGRQRNSNSARERRPRVLRGDQASIYRGASVSCSHSNTKPPVLIKQSTFFGNCKETVPKKSPVRFSRCLFTVHSLKGSIDSDTHQPKSHRSPATPHAEDWCRSRQKGSDKKWLRRVEYCCNPPGGYCWKENQASLG